MLRSSRIYLAASWYNIRNYDLSTANMIMYAI
jgi:hypothetical protein